MANNNGYNSNLTGQELENLLQAAGSAVQPSQIKTINGKSLLGEGNLDVASESTYIIDSFTATDINNFLYREDFISEGLFFYEEIDKVVTAVQQAKTIVIRNDVPTTSQGHYTCAAQLNETSLILQYTNDAGHFITLTTPLQQETSPEYWVHIEMRNSTLPIPQSEGQVLTVTSIRQSNTRDIANQIYDFAWTDIPQSDKSTTIIDNLESMDTTSALSANMGRVLNEKFHYKNYLAGKNLDQKGNILDAEGWNVTNPITVVGGTALTFECGGTNTSALCEYDADGNFLDYWGQSIHPRTITTKANTAYVRLAVPNNPMQDYFVAQNDVVLFNKLHEFDIVEQVAENTQKLENIGDSVEVKVENVTDANGKPLNEILNELSSGGGEGALVYNAPQTLTDEQKSQVAKNIGQRRERLILEWTNEEAEVLQPTAYDAETGYFTVESMPSWLAEDGAIAPATINYSNTLLVANMYGTNDVNNVPFSKDNTAPIQYIHRVSSSQFQVLSKNDVNSASNVTIDANTKCDYFYYTNTPNIGFKLAAKGEYGRKRFRVLFSNACVQFEKFADGVTCDENLERQNSYTAQWARIWNVPRPFANSGEYLIEVDLDNGRYRYLSYEIAGMTRTSATARSYLYQKSMNIQPWSNIWGWGLDNVYFRFDGKYIAKDTTIKLYEIIE